MTWTRIDSGNKPSDNEEVLVTTLWTSGRRTVQWAVAYERAPGQIAFSRDCGLTYLTGVVAWCAYPEPAQDGEVQVRQAEERPFEV